MHVSAPPAPVLQKYDFGTLHLKPAMVAALVEQGKGILTVVFQKDRCCHLKSSLFSTTLKQLQGRQGSPGAERENKL